MFVCHDRLDPSHDEICPDGYCRELAIIRYMQMYFF